MQPKKYSIDFAGRPLEVEFSNWAEQADGAAIVKYGETTALVTCVMGTRDRAEIDYLPLTVEYEERYYAAGKIYGSRFIRRESRPTEIAVLTGRMVDRTIRPRFNHRMRRDIQVVVTILSMDRENDPDFPALLGASLALGSSRIPFNGPVGGIRVASLDGKYVMSPSYIERENSAFDLFVGGTKERISMIEASGKSVSEKDALAAAEFAHQELRKLIEWQEKILAEVSRKKSDVFVAEINDGIEGRIRDFIGKRLEEAVYERDKLTRQSRIEELKNEMFTSLRASNATPDEMRGADWLFEKAIDELVHKKIVEEGMRPDGRKLDELRPIEGQVGVLPRTHGSAMFMRGNTHALSVVTLGAPGDILIQQGMEVTGEKRFMHHYNFPPYSVGETGPMRGPGRREIGHGALAEKALLPLIPPKEEFPYAIRIVSEILSSNGSSSMASVSGSSLALMDAGVPIKMHATGIAMGLMIMGERYKILTDIQGPEDHHGDMD
ncbi:MAG: polyribonucleotide nucleotidyltransferase, partial [Parcubacteria group bacterium]|nr:polyribonucleotide nucleotidyltransferase [Parcubacteria group bacterium]